MIFFFSFSSLSCWLHRETFTKMPLSMCALMLPNTLIPICQCQPWILAKLWRPHLLQNILTVFVGTVMQYPHMHRQAQLACASAAPLSVPVTLTPRQLLDFWQQLSLAASITSFQQLSVVTSIAVLKMLLFITFQALVFISAAIATATLEKSRMESYSTWLKLKIYFFWMRGNVCWVFHVSLACESGLVWDLSVHFWFANIARIINGGWSHTYVTYWYHIWIKGCWRGYTLLPVMPSRQLAAAVSQRGHALNIA